MSIEDIAFGAYIAARVAGRGDQFSVALAGRVQRDLYERKSAIVGLDDAIAAVREGLTELGLPS